MPVALYPGTFDPVTNGHVDIAIRASKIFSRVIAVVARNPDKNPLFSVEERLDMARQTLGSIKNVEVISYHGLIVNCLEEQGATVLIRGLRALSDFDYEFQMAFTNRNLHVRAETVFLMPSSEYSYLNSSLVKQMASLGGDIQAFVPPLVKEMLIKKVGTI